MTVWITGASGMLGRCVTSRLDARNIAWVGSDLDVDIADSSAIAAFVATHQPNSIVNCAAYTAVDAAETDENRAMLVNATGPTLLASAARKIGACFLHVSTDYVFDGEREGEHSEDSPVGPCNAYGRTKLDGERGILQAFAGVPGELEPSPWYIVRTSWLFGRGPSSFVDTMWGLMLSKPELRVVTDQVGRPTYAEDLAKFLVNRVDPACDEILASGVWHFANAGPTSWHGFAEAIRFEMMQLGLPVNVQQIIPVTSAEFPRPARRPKNSVLSTKRIEVEGIVPRSWRQALVEYLERRVRQ